MEKEQMKMADFLKNINSKMKKEYGADVIYMGKDAGNFEPYETGFPTIDNINSGIGGFPRGGVTLIHGLESTGKTTLVLDAIKYNMQVNSTSTALFIDVENSLTKDFLTRMGIDPQRLTLTNLNTEDALTIAKDAIQANIYDIIVIDSLAKLDSKNMIEGDLGDKKQRGQRARIITEFLRFISFTLRQSKTALILINQEIENQDKKTPYDPDTVLPCGKQQVYSANLRLQIKRSKKIKKGDGVVGYMCSITSVKNKIAAYERAKTMLSFLYSRGFVREFAHLDYLEILGIVKKNMGYYSFVDSKYYSNKFRAGDIGEILENIKANFGQDLTQIKPSDIDYETDGSEEVTTADDE